MHLVKAFRASVCLFGFAKYAFLCYTFARMKKLRALAFFFILFAPLFANEISLQTNFASYTLENGMSVFVLEDYTEATCRIQYTCRAGISSQTPDTAGFFTLYSRLFLQSGKAAYKKNDAWLLENAESECLADSTRYVLFTSPSLAKSALEQFSLCLRAPVFSDGELQKKLSALKNEVMSYSANTASFINASIDSRVFSEAPWKTESGIYPALFANTKIESARQTLLSIAENYYTPDMSALFISGPISRETVLSLVKKTFGSWNARSFRAAEKARSGQVQTQKKFVIVDRLFSKDITQVVAEYTSLPMLLCGAASPIFNAPASSFKKKLTSDKTLSLLSGEYANVSDVHTSAKSRLIFQAVFDTKNPFEKTDAFLSAIKNADAAISPEEFTNAKKMLLQNYASALETSTSCMETLSSVWALDFFSEKQNADPLVQKLFRKKTALENFSLDSFQKTYAEKDEPFVFVILQSDVYEKNKQAFRHAGWEVITQKNGSWYTNELYAKIRDANGIIEKNENKNANENFSALQNIRKNLENFSSLSLSNGIPIFLKRNPFSNNTLVMLSFAGGKIFSEFGSDLFSFLLSALTENISREFQNDFGTFPNMHTDINLTSGTISLEVPKENFSKALETLSHSLVFSDLKPACADGIMYNERMQKRLYNASSENQLFEKAIRTLFQNENYRKAFDAKSDTLTNVTFNDIVFRYARLLDAKKMTVFVTGAFDENKTKTLLENSFGILKKQDTNETKMTVPLPQFPEKNIARTPLRRLFFAENQKGKIPVQPPILVPTKNFFDPVQIFLSAPETLSLENAVFSALLCEVKNRFQKKLFDCDKEMSLALKMPEPALPLACFTVFHVSHANHVIEAYEKMISELRSELSQSETFPQLKKQIENAYLLERFLDAGTNYTAAVLMNESTDAYKLENPEKTNAYLHLSLYAAFENATADNFLSVLDKYFRIALRVYADETKE